MDKKRVPYKSNEINFWRVVVSLSSASLVLFANLYLVQPLLPVFSREFQITPVYSSLSLTLTTLSLVMGLLVFGFFSDRIGRAGIMRWSLLLSVLPLFLIPVIHSFEWLLLWRFFIGFMLAGLPAVAIAYINEEIDAKYRASVVSLFISSNALGGMAGRYLGGYFTEHFSWQSGFYALASISLLISLVFFKLMPQSRFFVVSHHSFKQDLFGMTVHLKNPMLVFVFLFGMMIQVSFSGIWTYIPFYLENNPFNLSIHFISLLYFTYLFGVVGSLGSARFSAQFGLTKVIFIGLIVMLTGGLLTLLTSTPLLITGLSLICFGFFISHSMASSWVGLKAQHHRSGATSLYLVSYYIGAAIGGTAIGAVWSIFGWPGVITICTILPSIAGLLFLRMILKNGQKQQVPLRN
ncbi:MFS transporter [Jeotgalibacillus soli]|uniref:Major facilitator superfamily (MFS) profile domain-containing protein n=1 Tax=Jeotgalibacillus soli TaxID=889306 RepID=A0A0C2V867_9BACL|nr:MFS transporter [Jeotgalibacillus soli]KIL45152.1 hypothetical protein KP78_26960 [Jeotgalibacillus soli]